MKREYKYLFGPVPSRRLGRSLGVDLTPFKTCTLDCIFCQLGRTTNKTLNRHEYAPVWHVESELDAWIKEDGKADCITLAGSGEPTLHTHFGEILQFARERSGIPTALLSNGTLLWCPEVRKAAKQADIVKLSLSAWDPFSFEHVNRPRPELKFDRILDGYRAFRAEYGGRLWIEVFLVGGANATPRDVEKIAALVDAIGPNEVHLNTAVRPPVEKFAFPVPKEQMESLARLFRAPTRVIAEQAPGGSPEIAAGEATILGLLKRHPSTAAQIAGAFGMHPNELSKHLGNLLRATSIREEYFGGDVYYIADSRKEHVHAGV